MSDFGGDSQWLRLPDLPPELFDDDVGEYSLFTSDVPGVSSLSSQPRPQSHSIDSAEVDAQEHRTRKPASRRRHQAHTLLPQPLQILSQGLPCLLMALSIGIIWLLGRHTAFGIPIWAAGVFIPSVVLAFAASSSVRQPWRRAALINLATMAIVFPTLVVRQSVVRIPFIGSGNGTLLPPIIATASVIILLVAVAIGTSILSQEDPELAGVAFLPTAMMVPALAGQSSLVSLSSGLLVAMAVFSLAAILTMAATVLPPIGAILIPPIAIALEFLVLSAVRSSQTFPVGASNTARVLFFTIVVTTVALTVLVPFVSSWVRQVTRLTRA